MKNKIISFLLVFCFVFSFPISAYAAYPPILVTDMYQVDISNLPDTSDIYISFKNNNYNIYLFYNENTETFYLVGMTDPTSNNSSYLYDEQMFIGYSSDESQYYLYSFVGSYLGDNGKEIRWGGKSSPYQMVVYRLSKATNEWTLMEDYTVSPLFVYGYKKGIELTNMKLLAFEMNVPQVESGLEIISYQYLKNGDNYIQSGLSPNPQEFNPATRKLYFNSVGDLSLTEDGPGIVDNGNGSVDLTETNGLISDLNDKIDSINTYVQNIRLHTYNSTNNITTIKNDIADIKSNLSNVVSSSSNLSGIKTVLDNIYNDLHDFKIIIHWDSEDENLLYDTYSLLESLVNDKFGNISKSNTVLYFLKRMHDNVGDIKTTLNAVLSSIGTTFKSDMQTEFTNLKSNITNNFSGLQTYLTGKYNTLYNVIIYGDKNGDAAYQSEKLEIEEQQAKLNDINSKISEAPAAIDGAADNVSEYISTFTLMYNNFVGLNVAISSVLYFGLAFILIKKVIGR